MEEIEALKQRDLQLRRQQENDCRFDALPFIELNLHSFLPINVIVFPHLLIPRVVSCVLAQHRLVKPFCYYCDFREKSLCEEKVKAREELAKQREESARRLEAEYEHRIRDEIEK